MAEAGCDDPNSDLARPWFGYVDVLDRHFVKVSANDGSHCFAGLPDEFMPARSAGRSLLNFAKC